MTTIDVYNLEVISGTRNHKGSFVQDTVYKLIEIEQSGWALICRNQATCHYKEREYGVDSSGIFWRLPIETVAT